MPLLLVYDASLDLPEAAEDVSYLTFRSTSTTDKQGAAQDSNVVTG
jgi:hypothetical protein